MSLEHSGAPTERQIRPAAGLAGCSGRQPDGRIQPRSPSSNRPAGLKLCVGDPAVLEALGPAQPAKSGRRIASEASRPAQRAHAYSR